MTRLGDGGHDAAPINNEHAVAAAVAHQTTGAVVSAGASRLTPSRV